MNAFLLISFCVGNIIGPLTFTEASSPNYIPAKVAIIVTCAVAALLALGLQFYYMWQNRKRERLLHSGGVEHKVDIEFADVTDRKNPEFKYQL